MMICLMQVFTPRKPDMAQVSYLTMSGTGRSVNNILLVCVFYCQETLKISKFFKDVSDIFLRARCFCVQIFYWVSSGNVFNFSDLTFPPVN